MRKAAADAAERLQGLARLNEQARHVAEAAGTRLAALRQQLEAAQMQYRQERQWAANAPKRRAALRQALAALQREKTLLDAVRK